MKATQEHQELNNLQINIKLDVRFINGITNSFIVRKSEQEKTVKE